jgi:molybdopterin converting factor subunit 1
VIAVTAQYFAAFREQAGCSHEALETAANTPGELYAQVAIRHGFADATARCKVAVNEQLADWDTPLRAGDVVLFFPPVAGG